MAGLSPASAGGRLCGLDNFLTSLSLRALISQAGDLITISSVAQCPPGPRQARRKPASFSPTEHSSERGTWARGRGTCVPTAIQFAPLQPKCSRLLLLTLPRCPPAPGPSSPHPQAHPGLPAPHAAPGSLHCLSGRGRGDDLGGQTFHPAFGCI